MLTAGRQAVITFAVACGLGLLIALVAITMEEMRMWTTQDSMAWFAITIPIGIILYQYWCWKWVRFKERSDAAA